MPRTKDVAHQAVAIAASAGGVGALSKVLAGLPADLNAAVLVLLHLSPAHDSRLDEVFGRVSQMPVAWAEDGEPLQAGRVYWRRDANTWEWTVAGARACSMSRKRTSAGPLPTHSSDRLPKPSTRIRRWSFLPAGAKMALSVYRQRTRSAPT